MRRSSRFISAHTISNAASKSHFCYRRKILDCLGVHSPRFSLRPERNEHQELPSVRHEIELSPVLGLHEALDRERNGLTAGRRLP